MSADITGVMESQHRTLSSLLAIQTEALAQIKQAIDVLAAKIQTLEGNDSPLPAVAVVAVAQVVQMDAAPAVPAESPASPSDKKQPTKKRTIRPEDELTEAQKRKRHNDRERRRKQKEAAAAAAISVAGAQGEDDAQTE